MTSKLYQFLLAIALCLAIAPGAFAKGGHGNGDKHHDIQVITQEIVSRMEAVIRRHPDQWYMFRQMWPRTERHDAEIKRRRFWGGKREPGHDPSVA